MQDPALKIDASPWLQAAGWFLFASLLNAAPARSEVRSGQLAQSVLGKPSFTADTPTAPAVNVTFEVTGVAIDPVTGKLFLSDYKNHRILRFAQTASYLTGASAEAVFGQADFNSGLENRGATVAANSLSFPRYLVVDSAGRLWVADKGNHRVLRFDDASAKDSGSDADGVLGQPDFLTAVPLATQATQSDPAGVAIDSSGRLWVGDTGNHRVLRYDNAAAKSNGANADVVLGQPDFMSNGTNTTATTMNNPRGVAVDAGDRLWVADASNNRVLLFEGASAKSNGAPADGVLGQGDFVSFSARPLAANSLEFPVSVAIAPNGILWVGDLFNGRVLGFRSAATIPDGANASIVVGQPNFTSVNTDAPTAARLGSPGQIALDEHDGFFVGDTEFYRVSRFSPAVELTAPASVKARRGRATIRGTSKSAEYVSFRPGAGGFRNATGVSNWSIALTRLRRTTTVSVRAVAFDGRIASSP